MKHSPRKSPRSKAPSTVTTSIDGDSTNEKRLDNSLGEGSTNHEPPNESGVDGLTNERRGEKRPSDADPEYEDVSQHQNKRLRVLEDDGETNSTGIMTLRIFNLR